MKNFNNLAVLNSQVSLAPFNREKKLYLHVYFYLSDSLNLENICFTSFFNLDELLLEQNSVIILLLLEFTN